MMTAAIPTVPVVLMERAHDASRIAVQNDIFRAALDIDDPAQAWQMDIAQAVKDRGPAFVRVAVASVASFDAFENAEDPFCERSFGTIAVEDVTLDWRIELRDDGLHYGFEDHANPSKTDRFLTITATREA